jgi:hypothetical protein
MNLIGGSRKTAMRRATSYSNGTTADTAIETVGSQAFSLDLEKRSFCALGMETLSLSGGDLRTRRANQASTAQSSETSPPASQASLSDRLTPSLISAGLVCGIIPTSMRSESGQQILDSVLRPQGKCGVTKTMGLIILEKK